MFDLLMAVVKIQ